MKILSIPALLLCAPAFAATNLAAICKDATPPADATCASTIYDVPQATDSVKGTGGYYGTWSLFGTSGPTVVCPADITRGATNCPVATVTVAASQVAVAPNTTGIINLSWVPVDTCIDTADSNREKPCANTLHTDWAVRGYRVLSGVKPDALTLLQAVDEKTTKLVLPGYGDGTYYFGVQAFNLNALTPNSDPSPVAQVVVKKPVTTSTAARPKSVSGVTLTVTF